MADLVETIVIPEVPRVLDGQELYVYIPKMYVDHYTKVETDALLATKVPITRTIAGIDLQDNITKNELAEALGVSPDLNIENGTGDVLVQTTDPDRSFKVMTDGRVKVYREPVESNDVLRLNEFSVLTQSQVDLLF